MCIVMLVLIDEKACAITIVRGFLALPLRPGNLLRFLLYAAYRSPSSICQDIMQRHKSRHIVRLHLCMTGWAAFISARSRRARWLVFSRWYGSEVVLVHEHHHRQTQAY